MRSSALSLRYRYVRGVIKFALVVHVFDNVGNPCLCTFRDRCGQLSIVRLVVKLSEGLRLIVVVVHDRDGAALVRRFNNDVWVGPGRAQGPELAWGAIFLGRYATCCRSSISSVIMLIYFSNVCAKTMSPVGEMWKGWRDFCSLVYSLYLSLSLLIKPSKSRDMSWDLGVNGFGTKDRPLFRTSVSGPVRVLTDKLANTIVGLNPALTAASPVIASTSHGGAREKCGVKMWNKNATDQSNVQ